jgi:phosphotransferase system IIB component
MTKRQKTISHLVTCMTRLKWTTNKKERYYWKQQIKKGLKIVNIKPW